MLVLGHLSAAVSWSFYNKSQIYLLLYYYCSAQVTKSVNVIFIIEFVIFHFFTSNRNTPEFCNERFLWCVVWWRRLGETPREQPKQKYYILFPIATCKKQVFKLLLINIFKRKFNFWHQIWFLVSLVLRYIISSLCGIGMQGCATIKKQVVPILLY